MTFKQFVKAIAQAKNQQDAIDNVFYGPEGIDMAYQRGKITWADHQLLLALINKMV